MSCAITHTEIEAAYDRIKDYIRKTPVFDCGANELGLGFPINLKLESIQHAGSFKTRGAFNNLLSANPNSAGFTAASGGNHGAAVAYACQALGFKTKIFVPRISSPVKIDRIKRYNAEVHVEGKLYSDAAKLCEQFQTESGFINIHPYDSATTIAGQGTLALEWERQVPDLDTVLVAIGGGGLIAGIGSWYNNRTKVIGVERSYAPNEVEGWYNNRTKVIGVEPQYSNALFAARNQGKPTEVPINSIAADSLGAKIAGDLPHKIISETVEDLILVEDKDIIDAQSLLWSEFQIIAEPGGATALAALISGKYSPKPNEKVGVLICGGNAKLETIAKPT